MASYEDDLIARARELQRMLTTRRRLRRQLRALEVNIKHERKALKAIKHASEGRRPDIAPSRLHAGVVGLDVLHDSRISVSSTETPADVTTHELLIIDETDK